MDILKPEGKAVLLGNEAIVRGALEAGVGLASAYPGTPSSEVADTFSMVAKKVGIYFEYSTNEKVALETAAGAAYAGVNAIVSMKHFGLNVASDSFMPVVYTGVKGALVIMIADDPGGFSSAQSEQDCRNYSRLAHIPTLEPSDAQECKDLTKLAFEISKKYEIPVLLRTTTKVSHGKGTVELGPIKVQKPEGYFERNPGRYYNIRPALQKMHQNVLEKLEKILAEYENINKLEEGKDRIGIVANGVSYCYVKEAVEKLGISPWILKVTLSYPFPRNLAKRMLENVDVVLVVEELDGINEKEIRAIAFDIGFKGEIHGKDLLRYWDEYTPSLVSKAIAKLYNKEIEEKGLRANIKLPKRYPVFCPGCPHRSTFYAVREIFLDAFYAGDIGCYILGIFPPYEMQDFVISMGASVGITHGIKQTSSQRAVVFIGDSTFFHAGMPGILNTRYNDHYKGPGPVIVVLDNRYTAMTGHQPHPGTGYTGMGEKREPVKIEQITEAFGIPTIVANAFNQEELKKALLEAKKISEEGKPVVVVSKGECRLMFRRRMRREGVTLPVFEFVEQPDEDTKKKLRSFGCPAIQEVDGKFTINPDLCWGCAVCTQIFKGIKPKVVK